MDSTKLMTFLVVCEEKSFSKAGDKLFITPAAIKKQIDALECEVGVTLFSRTSAGCILTSSGELFRTQAKKLLQSINSAIEITRQAEMEQADTLRVGHSVRFDYNFISDLAGFYSDNYLNKFLRFEQMKKSSLITALKAHTIDCFLYINPQKTDFQELSNVLLGTTQIHAVVQRNHPLAGRAQVSFRDLLPYDVYMSSVLDSSLFASFDSLLGANLHILDNEERNTLIFSLRRNAVILYPCPVTHDLSIPFEYPPMEIRLYFGAETPRLAGVIDCAKRFFQQDQNRAIM